MKRWLLLAFALLIFAGFLTRTPARVRSMISRLGNKWNNLHPVVKQAALNVIDDLARQGILVGIPSSGGFRTLEEQQNLRKDVTNVVNPLDSYHVWGLAVDFVPINSSGQFVWPPADDVVWRKIGAAIEKHGGEWGGRFNSFFDGPHGQWPLIRLSELQRRYKSPDEFIRLEHFA